MFFSSKKNPKENKTLHYKQKRKKTSWYKNRNLEVTVATRTPSVESTFIGGSSSTALYPVRLYRGTLHHTMKSEFSRRTLN